MIHGEGRWHGCGGAFCQSARVGIPVSRSFPRPRYGHPFSWQCVTLMLNDIRYTALSACRTTAMMSSQRRRKS